MTKADLVDEMAKALDSKQAAKAALDSLLEAITGALKKGDAVTLTGFGTFKVTERKARTGRNPQTGEPIQIAAGKSIKFSAGKKLKASI